MRTPLRYKPAEIFLNALVETPQVHPFRAVVRFVQAARDGVAQTARMSTVESRVLTVRIELPLSEVYDFLALPVNFPKWASGMAPGNENVTFTPRNDHGIADHTVHLPDGGEVYVPLRAIRNGTGTEVQMTLLRQPEMDDAKFTADAEWIAKDLHVLKSLLENG